MRGAVIYYSNTGNTRIACEYLKAKITNVDFELLDMRTSVITDLSSYDVIGFAFFADSWKPSEIYLNYVRSLKNTAGKFAFSFNTYGSSNGKAAYIMCRLLVEKGITLIGSHALHTPENYPPMIQSGFAFSEYPKKQDMVKLDAFLANLNRRLYDIQNGLPFVGEKPKISLPQRLLPSDPKVLMRPITGKIEMHVLPKECIKCGLCVRLCPVKAITMQEPSKNSVSEPGAKTSEKSGDESVSESRDQTRQSAAVIDTSKCEKCWSCYNHCPSQAIQAGKYHGVSQYPGPSQDYLQKFTN